MSFIDELTRGILRTAVKILYVIQIAVKIFFDKKIALWSLAAKQL